MATIESIKNDLSLPYLERPASSTAKQPKALVLLHGVGSNEQDMFQLAPYLPEDFTVISPRGPFVLGAGRYAWYEVDFSSGKPQINATQEAKSREDIQHFIRQVKEKYNLDTVYLGGFSQGAIMSFSIGLTQPELVAGIVGFSGRILQEIRPLLQPNEALKQLRVFISHGTQDGTLPVHYAREAKEYLEKAGVQLTYHEQDMGHQISGEAITKVADWLQV
ncbi:alpha/beta hydrolase [Pontibacter ramchanderi]|uniref:Phospholipase/carboxylesterase n=1 Tax=Pontibacter ramchanderi TaxID=1179743 RepID=A0A2N3V2T4_9BACT|nr:alpha/beta hydrolase [Pontibacter ramchanderi]PKV75940.1 phospholipase/carboxylesterase [Pontibacter ramchanderi]